MNMYVCEQSDFVYKPVKWGFGPSLFCKLLDCVKHNECYASMFSWDANCLFYRSFFNKKDNGWCMSGSLSYYPVAQGFIRCVASYSRISDERVQTNSYLFVNLLTTGKVQVVSTIQKEYDRHIFYLNFYENFELCLIFTKWEDIKQLEKYCKIFYERREKL